MSVDSPDQVLKVGSSSDFGWCKGTRKDGNKCTMPINVRECQWCHYHAVEALRRSGPVLVLPVDISLESTISVTINVVLIISSHAKQYMAFEVVAEVAIIVSFMCIMLFASRLQSKRPGFVNTGITRDYKRLQSDLRRRVGGPVFGSGVTGSKRKRETMPWRPPKPMTCVPGTRASMGAKCLK
eukprot:scaffold127942_cov23-Prasinocladus_malaysianus.AAC.1